LEAEVLEHREVKVHKEKLDFRELKAGRERALKAHRV
jgi:hypothetical protein